MEYTQLIDRRKVRQRKKKEWSLYLITTCDRVLKEPLVKVGVSKTVKTRLLALQEQCPISLYIYREWTPEQLKGCHATTVERHVVHDYEKNNTKNGGREWFMLPAWVLEDYIVDLIDSTTSSFRVSTK
jgi:hypothetical protein